MGLELAALVLSLLCTTASVLPSARQRADGATGGVGGFDRLGEKLLGHICALLRIVGPCPMGPVFAASLSSIDDSAENASELGRFQRGKHAVAGGSSGSSAAAGVGAWWSKINPTTDSEKAAHRTKRGRLLGRSQSNVIGGEMLTSQSKVSAFDLQKMEITLRIVSSIASFLRMRAALLAEQQTSAEQLNSAATSANAIDIDSIAETFCACAVLGGRLEHMQKREVQENVSNNSAMTWLNSSLPAVPAAVSSVRSSNTPTRYQSARLDSLHDLLGISPQEAENLKTKLNFISENLICAAHDLLLFAPLAIRRRMRSTTSSGSSSSSSMMAGNRLPSSGGSRGDHGSAVSVVDSIALVASEHFAPHSLVGQVARWIKDTVASEMAMN
jgi:hypothetical protein